MSRILKGTRNPIIPQLRVNPTWDNTSEILAGFAPFLVYVNTIGTISASVLRPFHTIEVEMDFGDTAAGVHTTGSRPGINSKNTHRGPIGFHMYYTPGVYTIRIKYDGDILETKQITVYDPDDYETHSEFIDTNTMCLSTSGTFTSAPAGSNNVTATGTNHLNVAIAAINSGATRRLLLRYGESFQVDTTTPIIIVTGPGIISAFGNPGDGLPKIIPATGFPATGALLAFGGNLTQAMTDWRVDKVHFDAAARPTDYMRGVVSSGGHDRRVITRCTATKLRLFVESSEATLDSKNNDPNPALHGHHAYHQHAVVDCVSVDPTAGTASTSTWNYTTYTGGTQHCFGGNNFNNQGLITAGTSHVQRFWAASGLIITNCNLESPGPTEHCIKLHGPAFTNTGVDGNFTEYVHISDNFINAGVGSQIPIAIGPPDPTSGADFRGGNVIIERNLHRAGTRQQEALSLWWGDLTVRNNIVDVSAALVKQGIMFGKRAPASATPAPERQHAYNNTIFSSSVDNDFYAIRILVSSLNANVRNNLGYAPSDSNHIMVLDQSDPGTPATVSNNSTTAEVLIDPLFTSATPVDAIDFQPQSGSYGKLMGVSVGGACRSDFGGVVRHNTTPTTGAWE